MTFDWVAAALAGFRLVAQRWRSLAAWTVMLGAMFVVGMFAWVRTTADLSRPQMMLAMAGVFVPVLVGGLAIIICAVYRIVLRPEERAFASVRLGADELRIALYFALLEALIVAVTWVTGASPWLRLAGFVVLIGVISKITLVGPAIFAERRFAVKDGWRMAEGHYSGLVGMNVITTAIFVASGYFIQFLWKAYAVSFIAPDGDVAGFGSPAAYLGYFLFSWAYMAMFVIVVAPSAYAYKWIAEFVPQPVDDFSPEFRHAPAGRAGARRPPRTPAPPN